MDYQMALEWTLKGKFGIFHNILLLIYYYFFNVNFEVLYGTHKYYHFDFDPLPSQGNIYQMPTAH